jgi:hypothetical protein
MQQAVSAQCTYIVKKIIAKRLKVLAEQACRAIALASAGRSAKGLRPFAVNKNLRTQWAQRANLKYLTANRIFFNLCG